MRLSHTARRVILSLVLFSFTCVFSCDPETIAPLPTPIAPDDERILTSSLTVTDDQTTDDKLVAMVGLPGAVEGLGELVLTNTRSEAVVRVPATELGTFSAALQAQEKDVFSLRFVSPDGAESEAIEVVVEVYDATKIAEVPVSAGKENQAGAPEPREPGTDAGGDNDCEDDENCTDGVDLGEQQPDTEAVQVLALIWSLEDGALRLQAQPNSLSPNAKVVISNVVTSSVQVETADDQGGLNVLVAAQPGDTLLIFTQSADDATATSPAQQFTVPQG